MSTSPRLRGSSTAEGFRELRVYKLAFELAMEIFRLSKLFPADENSP
jgi:hypothetical protein